MVYSKWEPLTTELRRDIRSAVDKGIAMLSESVKPANFKNNFKLDPIDEVCFNSNWWRYKGVRMNFGVFLQRFLVCYKCSRIVSYKTLQSLTRHLNTHAHKESCEIFHATQVGVPTELQFPVATGYWSKATFTQLYDCPFVREWNTVKSLSARKRYTAEPKTKQLLRDKYFEYWNDKRLLRGKPRLEEMEDNNDIVELAEGFGYVYDELLKGKKKSDILLKFNAKNVTKERTETTAPKRKREIKASSKHTEHDSFSLLDSLTDVPSSISAAFHLTPTDPQGYAKLFADFVANPKWKLSKSTASKYLRSFRSVVKQWSQVGLDLQNGYEEFIRQGMQERQVNSSTLNNVIAAVTYFVKKIAVDDYAKNISYERIKQHDPEKQPVFPLKYYEEANFDSFLELFGSEQDLKHVALFGYFAGLRIFEIMKLKC